MWRNITEESLPSVLRVETEREKEVSQLLKQATEIVTRLQMEAKRAASRERQLKKQLAGVSEKLANVQTEFSNYKMRIHVGSIYAGRK